MKKLLTQWAAPVLVCAFVLSLIPFRAFSQFQRHYGTPLDNSFSKVVRDGSFYYVLGQSQPSAQAQRRATVTRLDAGGNLIWVLEMDIASVWNDAVLTQGGDLLVVGATQPFDANAQSLVARVPSTGTNFTWLHRHVLTGRDGFTRIVKSPNPENPAFPYYILGVQLEPGGQPTEEDVVLLNLDENGTYQWKKVLEVNSDDEFGREMEVLPNGDLLLAGNDDLARGVIYQTDNTGAVLNGTLVSSPNPLVFFDMAPASTGDVYAVANQGNVAHLMKFNSGLVNVWKVTVPELTLAKQVWEGAPGFLYVTGRGNFGGTARDVVIKLTDSSTAPAVVWVKYLSAGSNYTNGTAWPLSAGDLAFTDERVFTTGFGGTCAYLSISDDEINTCLVSPDNVTLNASDVQFGQPAIPSVTPQNIPTINSIPGFDVVWQEEVVCTPCSVTLNVVAKDNCGLTEVCAVASGPMSYSYQWCDGQTTPCITTQLMSCQPVEFCVSVTCADGTVATASINYSATDITPPTAICSGIGVDLRPDCTADIAPSLIDGGSFDDCLIVNSSVSPATVFGCGLHPVTLTVEDWCGNVSSCSTFVQTIEVVPPVINCPPSVTKACDLNTTPADCGTATASDFCDPDPAISFSDVVAGLMPCDGIIQRTWQAADNCGNIATCVQTISIFDNVPPVIQCPPSVTKDCDTNTTPADCGTATATDNCDTSPTLTFSDVILGPMPCDGLIRRTWQAVDDCGNFSTCVQTITVVDNVPPVLSNCPQNITVIGTIGATGVCEAFVQIPVPTVTDNCDQNVTLLNSFNGTANASGLYPQGNTTVFYTAQDECNEVTGCVFTVTVKCDTSDFPGFNCGQAVVTCFSGFNNPSNYLSLVNNAGPVVALIDIRNQVTAPLPGNWWTQPSTTKYSHPQWTANDIGQVFGIAIDQNEDVFVAASSIYTCETFSPTPYNYDPFTTAGGPGAIYRLDNATGVPSLVIGTGPFTVGGTTLPNNGSALGNLCFDKDNIQFFVTNHADGMIYRIKNGLVMSRFDPFGSVNPPATGQGSDPSFVALGERTWGVGYYQGRVYFSRWVEDIGRHDPVMDNQIWSIGLDGSGEFQGTTMTGGTWEDGETLEIVLPCYFGGIYSNPVSDIAFSHTGKMLLGERTMASDCGGAFTQNWYGYAHGSRVLEYEFVTSAWNLTTGHTGPICTSNSNLKFRIGNSSQANCSGGVDYGYDSFDPSIPNVQPDCDQFVWSTGDYLHPTTVSNVYCSTSGTPWLYGLQGTPATGGDHTTSLLIDLDNNVCTHDKILNGDVEIFRCGCILNPDFPCDSLWVTKDSITFQPGELGDTCCWDIDLHIHAGPVAYLEVESITTGVVFNNQNLGTGFQWNTPPTATLLQIGSATPGHGIPQGDYNSALQFCLGNILTADQDTQCVVFRWYALGPTDVPYLACTDTCYFYCPPPICGDTCVVVKNDSLFCDPQNPLEYCYTFQVQNLSDFTATQVVLSNPTPGFTFKPCPPPNIPFSFPSLALPNSPLNPGFEPDSCSPTLCVKIVAALPVLSNQTVCFNVGLTSEDSCCHAPKKHCIELEPCCDPCEERDVVVTQIPPADSCCHSLDITNDCRINYFTKLELKLLTGGAIFGSHYTGGPNPNDWFNPVSNPNCIQWQHISGFVPQGTVPNLLNFCLDEIDQPSETPQIVVLNWFITGINGKDSIACADTLVFECEPTDPPCVDVLEQFIECKKDPNGNLYYDLTLTIKNSSAPPHFATDFQISPIGSPPFLLLPNYINLFPPGLNFCDITTVTASIFPTGTLNPGDKLSFLLRLHDGLTGDEWCCFEGDTLCVFVPPCDTCICQPNLTLSSGGAEYPVFCNPHTGFIPSLPCPANDVFVGGFMGCLNTMTGESCDETEVIWELVGPDTSLSGTTTNFTQFIFLEDLVDAPGLYCLTLTTICEGAFCPTLPDTCVCKVTWIQEPCPPDTCCLDYDNFCQNVEPQISISTDNDSCKAIVNIGNLPPCDVIEWVNWGDGNQTFGPFPNGSMSMHTYAASGTYIISILAVEYNTQVMPPQICFEKIIKDTITLVCDSCCTDFDAFCAAVEAATTLTFNPALCKATLNIDSLPCDDYIEWVNWGHGPLDFGPYSGGDMPMHTYPGSGTYFISWLAIEKDPATGLICFEKVLHDTISVQCTGCFCGTFTKIKIRNKKTGYVADLSCNNPAPFPVIPCPPSGKPHKITGMLACNGNCTATNINWTVMNPLGNTVLSGSSPGPWFNIPIPSTAVTVNGQYMVKLQGLCGTDTCECKINLTFDGCGPQCNCNELDSDISAGIYLSSLGGCQKEIHSTANLTECDAVTWNIYSTTQIAPIFTASTSGDAPLVFSFPGAGKYRICMKITRTLPDGTICMTEKCWVVKVVCGGLPSLECIMPVLSNPGFSEGASPGILGQQGQSLGWRNRGGTPEVVVDESCADPVSIRIRGNCIINDLIDHQEVFIPVGKSLSYEVCIRSQEIFLPGSVLVGRLSTAPQGAAACEGECEEVFRLPACCTDVDSFQVFSGSFSPAITGDNRFFTLHVENDLVEDDPATRSGVLVDNVCLELEDNVTHTDEIDLGNAFRLYPNPTSGTLTLDFKGNVPRSGGLQVLDIYGRKLLAETLLPGKPRHIFSLATLPAGIYFVQVVSDGVPVWSEKVVKQ